MKNLTFVVLDTIRRYQMWLPQQTVSVAVSGGLDSMALLHVLAQTQGQVRGVTPLKLIPVCVPIGRANARRQPNGGRGVCL